MKKQQTPTNEVTSEAMENIKKEMHRCHLNERILNFIMDLAEAMTEDLNERIDTEISSADLFGHTTFAFLFRTHPNTFIQ